MLQTEKVPPPDTTSENSELTPEYRKGDLTMIERLTLVYVQGGLSYEVAAQLAIQNAQSVAEDRASRLSESQQQ